VLFVPPLAFKKKQGSAQIQETRGRNTDNDRHSGAACVWITILTIFRVNVFEFLGDFG
jgi:hypothetical protein